ncbi:MAG: hypothetical protein AAGA60_10090 [Cyanobacteria bacterium P01_E01_bin.42]
MPKQKIELNKFDAFDIFWFILFLIAIAIALLLMWAKSSAFSTTMSVTDKHWQCIVTLQAENCGSDFCYWMNLKTEKLQGDSAIPLRCPAIRRDDDSESLVWWANGGRESKERLVREEIYDISFFDRDRQKIYIYQTNSDREYRDCKIGSERSVIINRSGRVKEILSELDRRD